MALMQEQVNSETLHQGQTTNLEDSEQVPDFNFPTRKNHSKDRHLG